MSILSLIFLILLFFITSAVGVITGSNSLITVPILFQFGIDPKVAVATNMFGLTFMSIGASIPFLKEKAINIKRLSPMILLTLIGSAIGAVLVGTVTSEAMPVIVSASMLLVILFTLLKRDKGVDKTRPVSTSSYVWTCILTFLLGIYGGLYSGGYTTLLTAVYVSFFGMTFLKSIASTKLVNVFSCLIATVIFARHGLIDYKLGIILAVTMFTAAYFGARAAVKVDSEWLRRIFLAAVFLLALKTIFDSVFLR